MPKLGTFYIFQIFIANKATVGLYVSDTLGLNLTDFSLASVTEDAATVTTVKADADTYTPKAMSLTTGADTGAAFTGGNGADTFTAAVLTANDGDILAGGNGADTLNVESVANLTENFKTSSIETVNLTALGSVSVDAKNMTGLTTFNSNDAAAAVIVNNLAATTVIGIKGAATNNIDLNYVTGALNGSADKLMVNLNGSSSTTVTADAGFESAEVKTTAASTLAVLTASGATALTLSGDATLTVNDNAIDSFTDYTVTNTAKVTYNDIDSVKTFNASANTGGIVGKDLVSSTELVNGTTADVLTMSGTGSLIQTGSGADNINVNTTALLSTSSGIVKLGAGNDILALTAGTSGEYVYAEAGDDTIYLATATTSSDLIDGGEGTDTLNLLGNDLTYAMIAKGIENVNVGVSGKDTTVNFVTIDSAIAIGDKTDDAVTFTNLKNGTTYTSSVLKDETLSLGFAASQAATINVNLTKGSSGAVTLTNVADATLTLGAASALGTVTVDSAATKLTIAATGALSAAPVIAASSTEKLQTVTVTGNKAITLGNITNDASLTSVSVKSTGGAVTVGTIGDAGNTSADVTVTKIEAITTTGDAIIGAIDFSGATTTVTGTITEITATAASTASADATIAAITADKIGTVTATSSVGDATIAAITVGLDTATSDYTDGTITAIKASGLHAASLAALKADKVDSIIVESTDTAAAHAVSIAAITDANGTGKATIGTVSLTSVKGASTLTSIAAAQVGNVTVSSGDDVTVGGITVTNSSNTSTTGNLSFTATGTTSGQDVLLTGDISVEVGGDVTAKSTGGEVNLATGIDILYADTTGATISLDGKEGVDLGGTSILKNTKGDLSVTLKAASNGANWQAGLLNVETGSAGYLSDIDVVVDASAVTGAFGYAAASNVVITNNGTDSNSSTIVKSSVGANFYTIKAEGGAVTVYGNTGVDTIIVDHTTTAYSSSTIYAEAGADDITVGAGTDTVSGGAGNDTIRVAVTTEGNDDTLDGGADTDTLSLTGASHTFATDSKLANIENISADVTGGISINLTGQTEAFTFTGTKSGATGALTYIGSAGVDTITAGANTVFAANTSIRGAGGNDLITLDTTDVKETIKFEATASANGTDSITGFTHASGKDVLDFSLITTLDGSGATGSVAVTNAIAIGAATGGKGETAVSKVITFAAASNASADWSDVLTKMNAALTIVADTTAGNADTVLIISNGTDSRAYLFSDDATSNATIEAGELTQIATLVGITGAELDLHVENNFLI